MVIHVIILNRTCTCACKFIKDYFIWSFVCNTPPQKKKTQKEEEVVIVWIVLCLLFD